MRRARISGNTGSTGAVARCRRKEVCLMAYTKPTLRKVSLRRAQLMP